MAQHRDRPHTFQEAIQAAREILETDRDLVLKGSIEAEAEGLVAAAYRFSAQKWLSRTEIYTRLSEPFPTEAADRLITFALRRAEGAPLQYITGSQFFLEHEYQVEPGVLIPRPETEILVLTALERLRKRSDPPGLGLEIGVGSGAIAVELLNQFPDLRMVASELSPIAAQVAEKNANRILGEKRAKSLKIIPVSSPEQVLEPFGLLPDTRSGKADFLISNPPYLLPSDPIDREVFKHEPPEALFAPGSDLIYFYRILAQQARVVLSEEAPLVFLEIPHQRADEIEASFRLESWYTEIILDLTSRPRVLIATL